MATQSNAATGYKTGSAAESKTQVTARRSSPCLPVVALRSIHSRAEEGGRAEKQNCARAKIAKGRAKREST
jgi:hypothetical protein